MPVLRPQTSVLVTDARFTAADLANLKQLIRDRTTTLQDAITVATRYADTLEAGVGSQLKALMRSLGSSVNVEPAIANLASDTGLLNGDVILPEDGRKHPSVKNVQRALIAIASRTRQLAYMLPLYGADGDYGNETTQAVKAFQQREGLPITGIVEVMTAKALDRVLRQTMVPGVMTPTPKDLVNAAIELCTGSTALNYGVPQPWVNTDPNHVVPVNRPFTYMTNKWKCNLFGGNVLRKGGYEPPYYGNQGSGEYPNANQWFKWSDRYAPQHSNKVHFQLIDEVAVLALPDEGSRRRAIANLLAKAQPGDFLMQDHLGAQIANGGHTRVTTANNFYTNGTVSFAQARYERAEILQEGLENLLYSEHLWLLRPNVRM
jgi:peptidoglycan hydrolase-like protein with peptidoglycan-binding domain